MVLFINQTSFISTIIIDLTTNVTGSLFLSLLIITFFFILIALMFRLPMEASAVILLPLLLTFMATESQYIVVGGIILLYLGTILGKNFILK